MDDGDSSNHTNFISKLKGFIKNAPFHDDVTEEEIISMVNEGHEQGVLLASEAAMIHNIFEFGDKEAKDIMTHRKNITAIDGELSLYDAICFIIGKVFEYCNQAKATKKVDEQSDKTEFHS